MNSYAKDVVDFLRERGIEATVRQVSEWASLMRDRWEQSSGRLVDEDLFLRAALNGNVTVTMCLHIHFGDAVDAAEAARP